MAAASHKFQAPKGMRDFYPADMAVRRHIENVWRGVSINHGFEEIDGPMFEHTDLYTVKSGPGIVSEIFGVFSGKDEAELAELKKTGRAPFALQPEFTPTLARMYAAQAGSLPRPTKWFSIRPFFRAERPQRGRLREFLQWNVDIIGGPPTPPEGSETYVATVDAEIVSVAVAFLRSVGLSSNDVRVKYGNREAIKVRLLSGGVSDDQLDPIIALLDDRLKITVEEYRRRAKDLGLPNQLADAFDPTNRETVRLDVDPDSLPFDQAGRARIREWLTTPGSLPYELAVLGLSEWCEFDSMVIRGLPYYTGTVFEIHEASGQERAVAGGGRYDKLIELFGGPPTPACGFAMGDVVLANLLRDKGLLKPDEEYLPRPDAFVLAATDEGAAELPKLVAQLRRDGLHVRHSYKSTRNVGKLLTEASKARARFAIILGKELAAPGGRVGLKDLDSGKQREIVLNEIANEIRAAVAR